ncbi:MAG TPA: aspartate-semialdehyde dehydrogenase [Candidatus Eremiobacteraceae bacterium]|jgi:aspartate-semialdehyde dehydrogenase|nr:aspartate-semialdehyde dehydrogenase [Candidatus Eremiobacteraceae bacterium]
MLRVGLIGWRGMVGSVLLQRMSEEKDFAGIEPVFFSTSNAGGAAPVLAPSNSKLLDAKDLKALAACDVLISCQGGDYTTEVFAPLRKFGWRGFWIDAASTLRMSDDAIIILDPVNDRVIRDGLARGVKTFAGGNCTVSLMLMAVGSLFQAGLVEWMTTMTYQAASGAGAAKMLELVKQMKCLTDATGAKLSDDALEVDRTTIAAQRAANLPTSEIGAPLAGSLIPWIDKDMPGGQTREEWKGMAETNKIMGLSPVVPVDGICVRVGTMRCHSQGLCIKLTKDISLGEIERVIAGANEWVRVVPNDKESTIRCLTPTAVSGTLTVPVGRLHTLAMGPRYLGAFTVGDQLLWGAAEPLRRMLRILREERN